MQTIITIAISLFITNSALAAPLTEREELTLTFNQLTQIEASLHRAQQSARTGINERYYFDYPRIHSDITTLRSGIEHYLTPARAQPRDTATLVGQYREEKTTP
ncbi:conjugal transfer protein [Salmonella enterica subsp. enterica serovar Legon]|uniref:integrative conjugative element protein, RAQPRD family n=1 Tax=Salmonella enterica TaxID=28901 RepID=UPI000D3EA8E8|nr:RAQPRD family integrative conjugative element protein [Salmonella enterica]PVB76040.1 conjugal transfer protein [Salmonella enterica subsp. enterica serovar Legon]PVB88658.1 conjugal transfer protein [Salmonella enterica subsp. enterica serovar Legon]PVB92334.1 conjugal transfer protein [Salmonella enterica subsp. enterica serovar Legon]PVB98583.1 conjugal transfer protein [Salmonella enterica subsp. enterica serovar Legon]PVC06198.1 conjugal transfer protein [Salmonella enterica subsp. ent